MRPENTYIMNLEACYIYKDIMENKKLSYKNRDKVKLFTATIPYSLETIRMDNMFPNSFYVEEDNKQYTRSIINVCFDKHYTKWDEKENQRKVVADRKKIRKLLYKNGFIMDNIHYVFYKRGAGKAKNGYAFFIDAKMKDKLIDRSRLGLKFEENEKLDLTSILAYESLITSGLEFTIELDPKTEILLIDDIYGQKFSSLASVTKEVNKELTTGNETIDIQNCLSDGQSLMDESVFIKYKKKHKGFMLLRSDMFKSCAFNTKLHEWFKHNEVSVVKDMFGNEYDASKVKLVITPNSLKFLKFAFKISDKKEKIEKESECYKYWQNKIDNIFGVVKCDKKGNFGNYNRLTYQLLNSIPNLTFDDLMSITAIEREYVNLLKNDNAVFKNYLLGDTYDTENSKNLEDMDLMNALFAVNSDIQYTKKFKKMKSDLISNYIGHLREGKIRIKDAKYVTLVSNPYEMLLASIGKYENQSIMKGREIYCKYYNDGQEFCASRNPHINAGNVMHTVNKYQEEYDKWFNFTENICAINFFDNDAPDRLQGCDTDSDTLLLIPNDILSKKAKYCEENFPTPINKVKGTMTPRKYNMVELQKLDVLLSNNYIGKIVNMSQIINSYLNEAIHKNEPKEIIEELYNASSRLSSMSQIEIDKSKKVFDNVSMSKELARMKNIKYIRYVYEKDTHDNVAKKMIVPKFFSMISEANEYRIFEEFYTPMDILQKVLVFKASKYKKGDLNKEFIDLLAKPKDLEGEYQTRIISKIFDAIKECGKKINGLKTKNNTLSDNAKKTVAKKSKIIAIERLLELTPSEVTILNILKQCFGENDRFEFKKYSILTLNLLFEAYMEKTLKCFKNKSINDDFILIKSNSKNNCDYNIFGVNYNKKKQYNYDSVTFFDFSTHVT